MVQNYSTTLFDFQAHWEVIVRVYVNLRGLKNAYARSRVVSTAAVFEEFIVGFNRELPLFEFIDGGFDLQASDNKILGWSRLDAQSCKADRSQQTSPITGRTSIASMCY